ncbi:hypothetical protein THARTR1_00783 [Trichoderma harzianum]|uniref:Uncharacterized protein n=1 Tax=Trichoderma harzianum TaxID=5544 RepID=A0A2K0UPC6_TRIHA|nr:hypothetical protein THARTR1_00783 [Trichoderma harzianum]
MLAYHLPKRQNSAILLSSPSPAITITITVCLSDALLSSSLPLGPSTASLQARQLRAVIGLNEPPANSGARVPVPCVDLRAAHTPPLSLSNAHRQRTPLVGVRTKRRRELQLPP